MLYTLNKSKTDQKILFYLCHLVGVQYSHLLHWLDGGAQAPLLCSAAEPPLAPKSVFPWCRIIWSWLGGGCWLVGGGRGSSSVQQLQQLQHPPSVPHQMQVLTIVWILIHFEVERQCCSGQSTICSALMHLTTYTWASFEPCSVHIFDDDEW